MKNLRLVFFGNEQLAGGLEEYSTPIFDALLQNKYDIAAVVLPRHLVSKSRRETTPAIFSVAQANNIPVIFADQQEDLDKTLRRLDAKVGVLASYGKIVKQSTIDVFPYGIVNIHPSLLPKYRGSTPIESAILNGDHETGVSLMQLSKEMDAGKVFAQDKIALLGNESKQILYEKSAKMGAQLLVSHLPQILSGEAKPHTQNHAAATYCKLLTKSDGEINPAAETAQQIERKIRAYAGWPKTRLNFARLNRETFAKFPDSEIIITRAEVLPGFAGDAWPDVIRCADATYLRIVQIISPKSGKEMSFAEYLRGLR